MKLLHKGALFIEVVPPGRVWLCRPSPLLDLATTLGTPEIQMANFILNVTAHPTKRKSLIIA